MYPNNSQSFPQHRWIKEQVKQLAVPPYLSDKSFAKPSAMRPGVASRRLSKK
jgi:hypothetical protein